MSSRRIVSGVALGAVVCSLFAFGGGCLTRPVEAGNPETKTNFTNQINESSIDKIDILFDIDNSASMGDKQAYLSAAIPDLITRLITPDCLDANGNQVLLLTNGNEVGVQATNADGSCPPGDMGVVGQPEFPAVHDMHIGILSSSLGMRGGDVCDPTTVQYLVGNSGASIPRHDDDQAHLLNRSSPMDVNMETALPAAGTSNFLYWYPTDAANTAAPGPGAPATTNAVQLETDFEDLVGGVHQFGCGIESQLESWYRFLIQPDPYLSIAIGGSPVAASWSGVDPVILKQRHDFLRPDSLVVIIVLTDENDSEVDVRAINGTAYNFMNDQWPPPRGTSACQATPIDLANCTNCSFKGAPKNDPSCMTNGGVYPATNKTDWGFDINLRHVHEMQKYGTSVQFPIERYSTGLTSPKVPNRTGEYPSGSGSYQGLKNLNCVNPLFAATLPDGSDTSADTLCNLTPGPRQPGNNLVYYAHIGGVPHELLQEDPTNPDSPQKGALTPADWTKILGNDPENFDYTGIDPHMIESSQPRAGGTLVPPGSPAPGTTGSDPINGREWVTDGTNSSGAALHLNLVVDREYACIFKLQDSTGAATPRQCDPNGPAATADGTIIEACDCSSSGLDADHLPAVCNYTLPASNPGTQQDYAKTYPTVRELLLAKLLGNQGIISSLCPIHLSDNAAKNDPLYGYRPAVKAIIDRLSASLQHQCLPQKLTPDDDAGDVPCLVLVTLPNSTEGQSTCTDTANFPSLVAPETDILTRFRADQHAAFLQGGSIGVDPSTYPTCQVQQILPGAFVGGNCNTISDPKTQGWCYVENAKGCAQAIYFTVAGLPQGADVSLQCLEASSSFATTSGATGSSSGAPTTGSE